jgi:hypothetical protein
LESLTSSSVLASLFVLDVRELRVTCEPARENSRRLQQATPRHEASI